MIREEGASSLGRGVVPNVFRAVLMNASQLASWVVVSFFCVVFCAFVVEFFCIFIFIFLGGVVSVKSSYRSCNFCSWFSVLGGLFIWIYDMRECWLVSLLSCFVFGLFLFRFVWVFGLFGVLGLATWRLGFGLVWVDWIPTSSFGLSDWLNSWNSSKTNGYGNS